MTDSFWYPSVEDVLDIHEAIVSEYPDTSAGIQSRGDIEFALEYISEGSFGSVPETAHEKAFHLLRLLVANHPFVDGNKRTALNTTTVFYLLNGFRFEYDDGIREILKRFGTDEEVDPGPVLDYLRTNTTEVDLNEVVARWRGTSYRTDSNNCPTSRPIRTINRTRRQRSDMATEEETGDDTPLDDVMAEIRRELVLRAAKADRDEHRDIYDALENE